MDMTKITNSRWVMDKKNVKGAPKRKVIRYDLGDSKPLLELVGTREQLQLLDAIMQGEMFP